MEAKLPSHDNCDENEFSLLKSVSHANKPLHVRGNTRIGNTIQQAQTYSCHGRQVPAVLP